MLALLGVYRIGAFIPTPGIDSEALVEFLYTRLQGTVFGFLDMFSGGNFRRLTIFALGIMPYITASIILQLLTVVWPYLEKLSKEGELGRRKITTYTRYLTVVLSAVQSAGHCYCAATAAGTFVVNPGIGFRLMTMLTLTTGTAFIMWLGEQITDRGIGNGMSLIIFAGIVVGLPRGILDVYEKLSTNEWSVLAVIVLVAIMVAVVAFIILVERGQRRITVQYAKRVVGRRVLGGQSTHLPLRVNTGGVIPVIFASSILTFPQTFGLVVKDKLGICRRELRMRFDSVNRSTTCCTSSASSSSATSILRSSSIRMKLPTTCGSTADSFPGIRPGKRTAEYVNSILTRITLVGALYLALIAIIPEFMITGFHVQNIPLIGPRLDAVLPQWVTQGLRVNFYFRRDVAVDCRRRRNGYYSDGRIAVDHASLRRFPEEEQGSREKELMGRKIVILLGHPGAGKGTQARSIMQTASDIPRFPPVICCVKRLPAKRRIGCEAKSRMDAGELVSDAIVNGIVADRIQRDDCKKRIHPGRLSADGVAGGDVSRAR